MNVVVRLLNPLLMMAFGLGAGVLLARWKGLDWRLYGIGAAAFTGSQIFHIPFNYWALNPGLVAASEKLSPTGFLVLSALALGLSAGVFEETARFLAFRFWLKDERTWGEALMFGAGHGGWEAILLGALTLFSVFNLLALRGADLATLIPAESLALAQTQVDTFWALPWYAVLLGAVERAATIVFHLSLSVLVLQAFTRGNPLWWALAVLWHALADAVAVIAIQTTNMYLTEGIIALFALAGLGLVYRFREPDLPPIGLAAAPPPPLSLEKIDPHPEEIEDSRYAP